MREYYEVLSRPKFAQFQSFFASAEFVLIEIESRALHFSPSIKLDLIADKDDNMILELADECMADFVITGNTTDFIFHRYKQTQIVTPKEYWDNYWTDSSSYYCNLT
jgi:putative PIN family toxin of toxin-antitoxin system